MNKSLLFGSVALLTFAAASSAGAAGFVNGGFETGDATGWESGGAYRGSTLNNALNPDTIVQGNDNNRSQVINKTYVDPNVGSVIGTTVYSGNYSYRVQDTTTGGYASVLQQKVENYTDANIFFAWKAVIEGAHGVNDSATLLITLKDLTNNEVLISRQYNAAQNGSGVDGLFDQYGRYFYTPDWQIEQLSIGQDRMGNDFLLSILAADCQPTGHRGYVYIDGFGAVTPPPSAVPEPATWAMMILGFGAAGAAVRNSRRRQAALAAA